MIKITVDEAAAFDMLSILGVKTERATSRAPAITAANLADEIADQLGRETYVRVIESPQFDALYETNSRLFDLIDAIKVRGEQLGDATAIDQLNYARYQGKRVVQDTFFAASPLTEVKIGYA